jgi:hypothetical protein
MLHIISLLVSKLTPLKLSIGIFFINGLKKMSNMQSTVIYMLRNSTIFNGVQAYYALIGLLRCVGSVDCVHIGWVSALTNITTRTRVSRDIPYHLFSVICTSQKSIQSVTQDHPGTQNDKHIF